MDEKIVKLENCLKAMKKCLKIPNVGNCICFSDAFKVLALEVEGLDKISDQLDVESLGKLKTIKKEIGETLEIISKGTKECLGCSTCMAAVVFKSYPEKLNDLYLENQL